MSFLAARVLVCTSRRNVSFGFRYSLWLSSTHTCVGWSHCWRIKGGWHGNWCLGRKGVEMRELGVESCKVLGADWPKCCQRPLRRGGILTIFYIKSKCTWCILLVDHRTELSCIELIEGLLRYGVFDLDPMVLEFWRMTYKGLDQQCQCMSICELEWFSRGSYR